MSSSSNGTTSGAGNKHRTEQETPLDATLATLVDDARSRQRGFALGVEERLDATAGRKEVVYRIEQVLPPADEWEPPAPYRNHRLMDIPSCVEFARRYGTQERTLVLHDDSGVRVVLNELVAVGRREGATMPWRYSKELAEWLGVLNGQPIDHRTLMDFLLLHQEHIEDPTILDRMRTVRASMRVKVDSDLRLEHETSGVVFESQAGPEIIAFPRRVRIVLPVLEDEVVTEEAWIHVEVAIEVVLPREAKDQVRFILVAPKLRSQVSIRLNECVEELRQELGGWCVLAGTHREVDREIGRERDRD